MNCPRFAVYPFLLVFFSFSFISISPAQEAGKTISGTFAADADRDHLQERAKWFLRGRVVPGKSTAELRHRAYQTKMKARGARLALSPAIHADSQAAAPLLEWIPIGPVPLASDATGSGFQDYHQVSGRATAVAIDAGDPTGNTVFIGGAQGGVWKATNAASSVANNVTWTPVTDDQATLSIGAIVIQPGGSDTTHSVVLAGTGEADNSADSYYGLGILRSVDGGNSWALISTANNNALSFSGLGATRMAFSTATGQTNAVVAAMAAASEGVTDGALTGNTYRGLYTSTDAGQSWTYDALFSGASEATSATSVVYNAAASLFFAALRYHGFYSSPDGVNWTRLANQPGLPGLLSTTACPQNYSTSCPIYRGEITVVPGRNEMYVWFVSLDSGNNTVDQGIWRSANSGASWAQINDSGITNCGDSNGCGVDQGFYNLELLAIPDGGSATDLYAGAINLYKCAISSVNPTCANTPFLNLTHVYGCSPLATLAHVHPDQHALAFTIPASGTDLMYFANDGGIYRALDGFSGLTTGSCSATNQFDDLNQNLGSMTQFVSFSEDPSNANTLLGGSQDNGSPATATATTSTSWGSVLSGDGGYSAIDASTGNWFASNPDFPAGSGGLNIQQCSSGMNCTDSSFSVIVSSGDVGGDDGAFYFPYILDPQSTTALLVGTCRVWRGPRSGGAETALSLNFDTFGTGTCAGSEVNVIRSLAAGGPTDANGSQVIYATTDGPGPSNLGSPVGGNVWVTTQATAVSGTTSTFANVTMNGPGGSSINPNQFPISSVAIDPSDISGNTAYVTIMGFTGGPGHVWQTTNAGTTWTDFTGAATNALPDAPANAVLVDSTAHIVYVGTDVGVFQSPTTSPAWSEVGPIPNPLGGTTGFLPNVAVTALALFNSGGQKMLRASTYGRGMWQFSQPATADFTIAVSNTPLTIFKGNPATFNGALTSLNGYNNAVALTCVAGSTAPPVPCAVSPVSLKPTPTGAAFRITPDSSKIADYNFQVQGIGSDPSATRHLAALTLHVVNIGITTPVPIRVNEPRGAASQPVSFQVTAQGSFNQSVTVSCGFSPAISGASCALTPSAMVDPTSGSAVNMTAIVTVPAGTPEANYTVNLQADTAGLPTPPVTTFTLAVIANPDFVLSQASAFPNVKAGSTGTSGTITVSAQDGFTGTVNLSCVSTFGADSCSVSPASVNTFPATATLVINGTSFQAGSYQIAVQGISGATTHSYPVPFNVGDYSIAGTQTLSTPPGGQVTANLTLTPSFSFTGQVNASCDATSLPGTQCTLSPPNPITIGNGTAVSVSATINVPNTALPGAYNINIHTQDANGAPVHSWTIALTVGQDFTIGALTPSSQTVTAGHSASYNFSVLPVGASFSSAVSLFCSGGPVISLCSFTPNPVTPGNSSAAVVMTISTTASSSRAAPVPVSYGYALGLMLPGLAVLASRRRTGKSGKLRLPASFIGLFVLALLLASCGGGGSNGGGGGGGGGGQQQGTQPGTYTITVTGTSGTLSHQASSTVTLIVN